MRKIFEALYLTDSVEKICKIKGIDKHEISNTNGLSRYDLFLLPSIKQLTQLLNMCKREYLSDNKTKESLEVTVEYIFCYRVLRDIFRTQLTTKTEHFLEIVNSVEPLTVISVEPLTVNSFEQLTIFPGNSILDVSLGS